MPLGDRRRSQRVLLSVAVRITGTNAGSTPFSEQTTTAVVNAHGGVVLLKEAVRQGQRLRVMSQNTGEETACVTVDANVGSYEPREVGIEFVAAAPRFWRVAFRQLTGAPAARKQSALGKMARRTKPLRRY